MCLIEEKCIPDLQPDDLLGALRQKGSRFEPPIALKLEEYSQNNILSAEQSLRMIT